ncbi:MAG TPA: vitamin K epoxide reductase family protein [Streptosporangiaceae bacterium]|jgi:uncharacterized membrane protein|nr:vitamin K epoxide reductase family protein [Streptosporangiaceae bacterium]
MATQKQAKRRRHATGAKKRTSHGNNRGRNSYDVTAAMANGAAKTGPNSAVAAVPAVPAEPARQSMPDWLRTHPLALTTWALSIIGLGVSIYLTITHYDTAVVIACSDKGLVNCEKVTTSPQSMVFGIFPVAVLGLAFYVFMFLINSPLGWRISQGSIGKLVRWTRLGSVIVGMGFVIYLIYAELVQIGNICLFCTSVHIVTFLMFVLLVYDATSWGMSTAPARRR